MNAFSSWKIPKRNFSRYKLNRDQRISKNVSIVGADQIA